MDRIELGYVARAHGVRGEVRVHLHAPESTTIFEVDAAYVGGVLRRIVSARPQNGAALVAFDGIDDRDAAEALRGQPVAVGRDAVPLADGEFLLVDLPGCEVVRDDGTPLGRIVEVMHGAQDVLVIQDDTSERMVPLVPELVRSVDIAARRVVVDVPDDLPVTPRGR